MVRARILRLLLAAAIVSTGVVGAVAVDAPRASAHDQLLGSSPAADAVLEEGPREVALDLSDAVLTVGASMEVVDLADKDWVAGEVAHADGRVSIPLAEGMAPGPYLIKWQVVSSDGDPTSGLIRFVVDGEVPAAAAETTTETTAESAPTEPEQEADVALRPAADRDGASAGMARTAIVGVVGAVIAAGLFALVLLLSRRRRSGGDATPPRRSS